MILPSGLEESLPGLDLCGHLTAFNLYELRGKPVVIDWLVSIALLGCFLSFLLKVHIMCSLKRCSWIS